MKYFNGVIVVEGKNDASHISSLVDSEIVVLNGYELNKDTLTYLTHIKENRIILLLTDPDEAGQKIKENFLKTGIKSVVVNVDIKMCNKHKKHGVAECAKEEILKKLKPFLKDEKPKREEICLKDLKQIGLLESEESLNFIKSCFYIGKCNLKTFLKRLNYNSISLKTIKEKLGEFYGNQQRERY